MTTTCNRTLTSAEAGGYLTANVQRQAEPLTAARPGAMWRFGNVSNGRNARDFRDVVEPVVLPERQEPLGLGGERVDGRLGHGLAVEDPVLIAARADLGPLGGVSGPHGRGQRRVKLLGKPVHLGHGGARGLGLA